MDTKLSRPLPPASECRSKTQIVQEVERRLSIVDEIEAQVEANLKRAARLRQGILKRAFEGRLVPQDPTDEPAEKLLERIRQQRQPATTMYNGRMGTRRARRRRRTSDPVLPFRPGRRQRPRRQTMSHVTQTITLTSDHHYGRRLPPQALGHALTAIPAVVRQSVSMAFRGRSRVRRPRPRWLKAAADIRFIDHQGDDASVLYFEAPTLGEAAAELYQQQEFWSTRPTRA